MSAPSRKDVTIRGVRRRRWMDARCAAAVAIRDDAVETAVADRRRGIRMAERIELPGSDPRELAAALRRAAALLAPWRRAPVVAVAPGRRVPLRRLTPPLDDPRRLAAILGPSLEPLLPFDLETAVVDAAFALREGRIDGDLLAMACPIAEGERVRSLLASAGVAPSLMDHEILALARAARARWTPSGPWSALAAGDRSLAWVFGDGDRIVAGRVVAGDDPAAATSAWQRARRVPPELDGWEPAPEDVRILGPRGAVDRWRAPIADSLGFDPPVLDDDARLRTAPVACGAALRGLGREPGVDLLPTPARRRPAARRAMTTAAVTAALAAVGALTPVLGELARGWMAGPRLERTNQALGATARDAGVANPPPMQEVYALRQRLEEVEKTGEVWAAAAAEPICDRIDRIVSATPQGVRIEGIAATPASATVRARAADIGAAHRFRDELAGIGRDASMRNLPGDGERLRFEMTIVNPPAEADR